MQERERARLQKMGTSSLQQAPASLLQPRKKRSFSLPSLRRPSVSAGERPEVARSAEEAARVQKAAAWQWYTRGVGDPVVPTKRSLVSKSPPSPASKDDKSVVDARSIGGDHVLLKKPLEPPPLPQSQRAASRFKSEAAFARPPTSATASAPSAAPATPLYDEFELSGLRIQMADFVQRLQQYHQTKDNEQTAAVADHQKKAKPLLHSEFDGGSGTAAASDVSTDHQKTGQEAAAAIANYHQLTKTLPPSATPVPFRMRPFSALHRLFRKVVSGSIIKSTKNSPLIIISSPEIYEPKVFPVEEAENSQYHYHHYIHHHHHHYHYNQSPEESAAIIRSRRRHSESSGIRPLTPSPWEEELSDEEEESVERSPIEAYLARRRRHSDSFAEHLTPKKGALDEEEGGSNSERFSPNKIPTMDRKGLAQPAAGREDEFDEELMDIKSRRHSVENSREEAALERKAEGAGKSGRGTYKLGGAEDGTTTAKPLVRRRHSEGLQRPEGVQYEMGKRTPSPPPVVLGLLGTYPPFIPCNLHSFVPLLGISKISHPLKNIYIYIHTHTHTQHMSFTYQFGISP